MILDFGVDTGTAMDEPMAHMVATSAEAEQRRIAERTRDALAELGKHGVRLGRSTGLPDVAAAPIVLSSDARSADTEPASRRLL